MALDTPDLLLEDLVPEPRLELTLPRRSRRDAHSILTTTKENLHGVSDTVYLDERN